MVPTGRDPPHNGDFGAAEGAYREASRLGREPQPGLALLRLAQGEPDAAASTIRRVVGETAEAGERPGLLPAYIEIMLAVDDVEAARGARSDHANLDGGYAVCFETHTADADLAPLFRGLLEDRAQLPRWGYVIEGKIGFRFADREETYETGDAYYVGPGHTPVY